MRKNKSEGNILLRIRNSFAESFILPLLLGLLNLESLLSFQSPIFITVSNITNVFRQVSIIHIVLIGISNVVFAAGIVERLLR